VSNKRLHAVLEYRPSELVEAGKFKQKFVRVFDGTNPAHKYLQQLGSKNSQVTMGYVLDRVAKVLMNDNTVRLDAVDWTHIGDIHLLALIRFFSDEAKLSPYTVSLYASAVKSVMVEAYFLEMINEKQLKLIQRVKVPRGSRIRTRTALTVEEIQTFFAACDDGTALGARDAAAFSVLVGCGLRREEAATLSFGEVDFGRAELRVIGKGNKQRAIPLQSVVEDKLLIWIDHWRGEYPGALFTGLHKNGSISDRQLSVSGLYKAIKRRGVDLPIQPFMIHDLRRTYGTMLLNNEVDIFTVQDLLGHESSATTKKYDMRGHERKRKAVDTLKF
jgi:integrase/recombinase XerD